MPAVFEPPQRTLDVAPVDGALAGERWDARPAHAGVVGDDGVDLLALLRRHAAGDWGDGDAGDRRLNTQALYSGGRLLSVYETAAGTLWIITEADRSATTLLRPDDD